MADNRLERLWEQLDGIRAEIVQLEARRVKILKKIRKHQFPKPSHKKMKILFGYLHGISQPDLAREFGVSRSYISKVIKECLPAVSSAMDVTYGSLADSPNVISPEEG